MGRWDRGLHARERLVRSLRRRPDATLGGLARDDRLRAERVAVVRADDPALRFAAGLFFRTNDLDAGHALARRAQDLRAIEVVAGDLAARRDRNGAHRLARLRGRSLAAGLV